MASHREDRGTKSGTTVLTFPSHLVSEKKGRDKGKVEGEEKTRKERRGEEGGRQGRGERIVSA